MRLEASRTIEQPVARVWGVACDPAEFLPGAGGFTRCERLDDDGPPRVGAQYRYAVEVGGITLGGTIELTRWSEGHELAWTSVTGVDNRGWLLLREVDDARTEATLRLGYHAAPGVLGLAADRAAEAIMRRRADEILSQLATLAFGAPHGPELDRVRPGPLDHLGRAAHVATTLLRAGVVPTRIDRGLRELVELARWGTTLTGLYAAAARVAPERVAVADDTVTWTFAELDDTSDRLAGALAAEGVAAGGTVGLLARNSAWFVATLLALGRVGAHVALLNTGMSPAQAAAVIQDQGLGLVVVDDDLRDLLAEVDDSVRLLRCVAGDDPHGAWAGDATVADLVAATPSGSGPPPPDEPGRTIVMTSGTTGTPKGARRPATGGPDAAAAILSRIPYRAGDTTFVVPPLFHTWGLANLQLAGLLRSTLVLRRRFDPAEAVRVVDEQEVDVLVVVPVMLRRMLDLDPDRHPSAALNRVRVVASSGSALGAPLAQRWLAAHGHNLHNLYGSTEVSWATIASPHDLLSAPGTAGRPPRGTTVAILDDDGRPVPTGVDGRIFVGNDLQFEGYTGDRGDVEVVDGLLATGDVGHLDAAGLLFVAGRSDDMVVSGGENVFPGEVEDLLAGRDDIAEVAVVGVDDDDLGQRLAAFVVPADPDAAPDPDEVRAFVKERLARFSVPRDVVLLDELPRNPTGKVVRSALPT